MTEAKWRLDVRYHRKLSEKAKKSVVELSFLRGDQDLDYDNRGGFCYYALRTNGIDVERPWIPERSATRLREADLNILSEFGKQGLEWRLEPEAFTGREVGREDDLLDVLVGCAVDIEAARQPST